MRLDRLYTFFIATYFAQGMIGIAYEPIYYLQKDVLKLSASQAAVFTAWMSAPFLFKPLLGLISDGLPLRGLRRRPYLLLSAVSTALGWATLAVIDKYEYVPTLVLLTLVNVGISFSDVLCDGVMVERGKKEGKTGAYQAAQIGTLYLTLLVTGIGGGWLAQHAPYALIFGLTALFPLLIFAVAWRLPEKRTAAPVQQAGRMKRGLLDMMNKRGFWAAAGIILLFNFSPFKGTPMFYYQNDALGFSKLLIGSLISVDGICGAIGAALFWKFYNREIRVRGRRIRFDTMTLIRWSILAGAPLTLAYIAYRGPVRAFALTAFFGVVGVIMRLSLMDLAAKACPEDGEATGFAIFMSVFNLAAWSSNTAGAHLYDAWRASLGAHGAMAALIAVNAATIALCWPLLRALPRKTA